MQKEIELVRKIIFHIWAKSKISYVKEFPEGYNNVAFDVKILNPDKNVVIKLINVKSSEYGSKKEAAVFEFLKKKFPNYPVPEVIKFDSTKKIIPESFIITERIKGEPLRFLYDKIKNKSELFEKLGELKGLMHSIHFKRYGELDEDLKIIKPYKSWYAKKNVEIKKLLADLKKANYLNKKFVKLHYDFWNKIKRNLKYESAPCLCHGDTSHSNIIVDKVKNNKYKINGLIDFEFAHSGGAVNDLFRAVRNFEQVFKHRKSLVKGYVKYSNLPHNWERLMWIYQWKGNLSWINGVKEMKWRNLTARKTKERRKHILEGSIQRANEILKRLS